ncbi:CLUMA_CG014479, isoform A [Clunio marinus]|uniref:CLUMA_CG014479, isoform A n=1 Tax=Clunio marinus TaxID=568069 RepID=A0A1J1ISE3_9DIPT|nr:CLUMA_CG014479, isoform A [Clunio marinus]
MSDMEETESQVKPPKQKKDNVLRDSTNVQQIRVGPVDSLIMLKEENAALASALNKEREEHEALKIKTAEMEEKLQGIHKERARLLNTVLDLKGNIRIFARVRPPMSDENDKIICDWSFIDETTLKIFESYLCHLGSRAKCCKFQLYLLIKTPEEEIISGQGDGVYWSIQKWPHLKCTCSVILESVDNVDNVDKGSCFHHDVRPEQKHDDMASDKKKKKKAHVFNNF